MKKDIIFITEFNYEIDRAINVAPEILHGSVTAGAICIGVVSESSVITSSSAINYNVLPYAYLKPVINAATGTECRANFNNLTSLLVDDSDERYFISTEKYSYTGSLFYGYLSIVDELKLTTALSVKKQGYHPVVYTDSALLADILMVEKIDFISTSHTSSFRQSG
ncbi:MAG: hypothetical protein Q8M92_09345 [Candidatus Subteraquimicrobiales bacterium]|nr:hypothetical protein [Candidatus Subteraquimicrobiales bacterium]